MVSLCVGVCVCEYVCVCASICMCCMHTCIYSYDHCVLNASHIVFFLCVVMTNLLTGQGRASFPEPVITYVSCPSYASHPSMCTINATTDQFCASHMFDVYLECSKCELQHIFSLN